MNKQELIMTIARDLIVHYKIEPKLTAEDILSAESKIKSNLELYAKTVKEVEAIYLAIKE